MDSYKSNLETLDGLLPGIQDFLQKVLANETLTIQAEKIRQNLLERLEVLKLPENPPRKPENLPPIPAENDFAEQQRRIARETGTAPPLPPGRKNLKKIELKVEEESDGETYEEEKQKKVLLRKKPKKVEDNSTENDELYDDLRQSAIRQSQSFSAVTDETYDDVDNTDVVVVESGQDNEEGIEDLSSEVYELPMDDNVEKIEEEDSDDGWSGSHQSYENLEFHKNEGNTEKKEKKTKKETKDIVNEWLISNLTNVVFIGDLHFKGKGLFSWKKRYCVINDDRLLVYKSEKATHPSYNIHLTEYDVEYLENEGKRNYVIKLSGSDVEEHHFSGDSRENTEEWLKHMWEASGKGDLTYDDVSMQNTEEVAEEGETYEDPVPLNPETTSCSSISEGGSGDGVVGLPLQPEKKQKGQNIMKQVSGIFTIGRKKGKKMSLEGNEWGDPDASIADIMKVCGDLMSSKKWSKRLCVVKQGKLCVYKDATDTSYESAMTLKGIKIEVAKETKKELALKLSRNDKVELMIEPRDTLEQGRWLKILIEEAGLPGKAKQNRDSEIYENTEEGDQRGSWNDSDDSGMPTTPGRKDSPPPMPATAPPQKNKKGYVTEIVKSSSELKKTEDTGQLYECFEDEKKRTDSAIERDMEETYMECEGEDEEQHSYLDMTSLNRQIAKERGNQNLNDDYYLSMDKAKGLRKLPDQPKKVDITALRNKFSERSNSSPSKTPESRQQNHQRSMSTEENTKQPKGKFILRDPKPKVPDEDQYDTVKDYRKSFANTKNLWEKKAVVSPTMDKSLSLPRTPTPTERPTVVRKESYKDMFNQIRNKRKNSQGTLDK